ncbi:MAG: hypothetical protein HY327_04160 [Chloroflexi bacterium]|nr:hypothetical protein [Chloroflexota bacterium]
MSQSITIRLSETAYSQLHRAAELAHQSVDMIVEQSLAHSLPALVEEIPLAYQPDVYPLLQMSDAELTEEAHRRFPVDRWTEYQALLAKKKELSLTTPEQDRLAALRRESDVLSFRKGYAAVLLKRRGYRLPTLAELSRAQ